MFKLLLLDFDLLLNHILLFYKSNYIMSRESTSNLICYLQSNYPVKFNKKVTSTIDIFLKDSKILVSYLLFIISKYIFNV
jgi:hypothetical protein